MMMFDSMIESILMCEAEIWGWKKQEEAEKVQEKYLRGLLRMDRVMAGYIVRREECKRNRKWTHFYYKSFSSSSPFPKKLKTV
jgi:hypothetical protein